MAGGRRVLVLAYFFPPIGGAGVQRTLKALKYLPAHGWSATVVTTASRAYPASDPSLGEEIPPGTRVVRAAEPALWRMLVTAALLACRPLRVTRLRPLIAWPDRQLPWGPFALLAAFREIRRARPDAIYSTAPPHTAHIVGWILHRLTGIPLVVDFRDEWSTNPHADDPALVTRMSRRTERAIAAAAARVTVVADWFDIAGADPEGVTVIPNGVDEDDFPANGTPAERADGRLRISHVGTLYGDRDCGPVLAALGRLVADGRIARDDVELRIVGNDWLEDLDARVPVRLSKTGYLDHRRAVAEMREADVLLLYVAPTSLAPSGKLFEYLASERPILCVTSQENLAARLVREWDAGLWAAPGDGEAIERAILELVERQRAGALRPVPEVRRRTLETYSRRAMAARLAAALDDAAR
jgi:glycosyltransferase involved in cell wall biosynthesis